MAAVVRILGDMAGGGAAEPVFDPFRDLRPVQYPHPADGCGDLQSAENGHGDGIVDGAGLWLLFRHGALFLSLLCPQRGHDAQLPHPAGGTVFHPLSGRLHRVFERSCGDGPFGRRRPGRRRCAGVAQHRPVVYLLCGADAVLLLLRGVLHHVYRTDPGSAGILHGAECGRDGAVPGSADAGKRLSLRV